MLVSIIALMVSFLLEKLIAIKLTVTTAANPLFYSIFYTEVFCCIQKHKILCFYRKKTPTNQTPNILHPPPQH